MERETDSSGERIAKVEGILEQMSERLNHMESRITALEDRLDSAVRELRGEISSGLEELRAQMGTHFRWTIALIITMWVTVIAAVLFGG